MNKYYEAPSDIDATKPVAGLTTAETIYSAIIIACGAFFIVPLAMFHFVLIPADDEPEIYYFVVTVMWFYFASLTATAAINFWRRSLLVGVTVFQICILCLTMYMIPLAIWGGTLLYLRIKRNRATEQANV